MANARSTAPDPLATGWAQLGQGEWKAARSSFEDALTLDETPEALEGLSWAAWWLDDAETMFDARERAYAQYRLRGDRRGAGRMASWLGTDHVDWRGELAVARGWLARARRLLADLEPGPEHGWLWVHEAEKLLYANDTAGAGELGARAAELGRGLGLVALEMMGLATEGLALITQGDVDGVGRMDEAAAAALAGEFDELAPAAWCCCYMLYACERLRDYDRAAQWCKGFEEWSDRMGIPFANGLCRAHYAGILVERGSWAQAEAELIESAGRLGEIRPPMMAEATVRLGELRRRQGRLEDAHEMFTRVADHPRALLGFGEVCLGRSDPAGARDRAEQYLRETPPQARALRAPALELLVRANAALGEGERAAAALRELDGIAEAVASDPLRASAALCAGIVAYSSGDRERGRAAFEDAVRLFQRSGAPFEAARARLELAGVLRTLGREATANEEIEAALGAFRELGAIAEAARAEALLGVAIASGSLGPLDELTNRELEVLALVAEGLSNQRIAERLVISEHTVKRHVANILRKLELPSRAAAASLAGRHGLWRPDRAP